MTIGWKIELRPYLRVLIDIRPFKIFKTYTKQSELYTGIDDIPLKNESTNIGKVTIIKSS